MKNSIAVAASVTRTTLGLAPLQLDVDGVTHIVSITEGGVTWRRTVAEGKYQRGRALLSAVRDTTTDVLVIRVYGPTGTDLENRVRSLITAFSQFTYTVTLTLNGVTRTIDCEPADIETVGDDTRRKTLRYGHMRELQISIPRDPQLIEGAI